MADDGHRQIPRGWVRHPRERMLITPLMAGIGGMLAFFTVVFIVVWLPIHTFDPPASADWAPLANDALKGRDLFAANGCYVCHSGYSRPQDVRAALYFLYPKVSQPGDFFGSDQSPNILGTERTGPDLSQESGWHPDDWQRAHFYDPRFVDPMSLMPDMKSLFSDGQIDQLVSFVEQRSGKSGLLRYAGQLYAKHVVLVNQGFPQPYTGFQGAHKPIVAANEKFGDRLSVDDIWRLVLFVKTIPNGTLKKNRLPAPSDYIVWQPTKELLAWVKTHQRLANNADFDKKPVTDPFRQEAMRIFPGLAPGDTMNLNDGKTQLSLESAAAGIRALYEDMLNRAWSEARARGETLPPSVQKDIPPTVPGQQ